MNDPIMVPLSRLRPNQELQPRDKGLDERHIRLLMASDPAAWPPLGVTPNEEGGYDVYAGFHRFEAARRLGLAALPCVVDPDAGYPEAVADNLGHGLPLALADRKTFARWLHDDDPGLSLREIGRRAGLNHETVKRALRETDGGGGADGENRQASPDPIPRLVGQVVRAYAGGHGRTWFGLGRDGNPKPFRAAIASYAEDEQRGVAQALGAFGRACIAAAAPFLAGDEE
jgi:hypothetical protein